MNIMISLLAGGAIGWVGYSYVRFNEDRGLIISIIIGVIGGFLGGNILAPIMFGAVNDAAITFSVFSMAFALTSAAACLAVGNVMSNRYGV
jgi:uncharacterized membrane protein YeaQ/YmgE (transglycosylase-associated protein family)